MKDKKNDMEKEYICKDDFIDWIMEKYCKPCEKEGRDYQHCRCGMCQYDDMMSDVWAFPASFTKD